MSEIAADIFHVFGSFISATVRVVIDVILGVCFKKFSTVAPLLAQKRYGPAILSIDDGCRRLLILSLPTGRNPVLSRYGDESVQKMSACGASESAALTSMDGKPRFGVYNGLHQRR